MRTAWKRLILGLTLALAFSAAALPSASAHMCIDLFREPKKNWTVQDAIDLIRQVSPARVEQYNGELSRFTRVSLYPIAAKLRPEVLRLTGDYEQAAFIVDSAFARDRYIRSFLSGKFKVETTDKPFNAINRRLFNNGLKTLIEADTLGMHRFQRRDKLAILVSRVLRRKPINIAYEAFSLQYRLPKVKDAPISEQLLTEIMIDGPAAHRDAIAAAYKQTKQNRIEFYRRVDTLYRVALWAVSIAMIPQSIEMAQNIYDDIVAGRADDKFFDHLEALEKGIQLLENELEDRL